MMNRRVNHAIRLSIIISAFSCVSCHGLRVYVNDKAPPAFTFDVGSFPECCTEFTTFAVFEEDSNRLLWRIVAKTIITRNQTDSLKIEYGKVPDKFLQEYPQAGAPAELVADKHYLAVAGAPSYVPWARVRFIIKDNGIETLPVSQGSLP